MLESLGAAVQSEGFRVGLIGLAFVFGLRHGIDWDHIAAITDIAGSQTKPRRAVFLSTVYALGHAVSVLILGSIAIIIGDKLPAAADAAMERVVGVTLLVLGAYVIVGLLRHGRDFRLRSRWMLIVSGIRWLVRRLRRRPAQVVEIVHAHDHAVDEHHGDADHVAELEPASVRVAARVRTHTHAHRHRGQMPADPFTGYGRGTSFCVGILHGIGAETPTQVLLFVTAVGAGGPAVGVLLLAVFLAGIFVSNTSVAVASAFGFLHATRSFRVYATIAVVTSVFSLVLGTLYVLGRGSAVPAIFGG